jgi:hypothetical protein
MRALGPTMGSQTVQLVLVSRKSDVQNVQYARPCNRLEWHLVWSRCVSRRSFRKRRNEMRPFFPTMGLQTVQLALVSRKSAEQNVQYGRPCNRFDWLSVRPTCMSPTIVSQALERSKTFLSDARIIDRPIGSTLMKISGAGHSLRPSLQSSVFSLGPTNVSEVDTRLTSVGMK